MLEVLAGSREGLTLAQVARACGLNRATARRILHTLVAQNYAMIEDKRFLASTRVLTLGRAIVQQHGLWGLAERRIRDLSHRFNETFSVAILERTEVVYVARELASHRVMTADLTVGMRLPAWCTSMGRSMLACLAAEERRAILAESDIRPFTEHTLTDLQALQRRIAEDGRLGYSLVDQELERGLRSLAVPLQGKDGTVVAAINVATSASHTPMERLMRDILPALQQAAGDLKAAIDFT